MALHTYNLDDLKRAAVHALAGAPDANLTTEEIVNDAILWFVNKAPWRWRHASFSLASVDGQNYIALPSDFGALETVKLGSNSAGNVLVKATMDTIVDLRAQGSSVTGKVFYDLGYRAVSGAVPTPILDIYPTPTASTAGYLVGIYLRKIPKLVAGTDVPEIPAEYHPLLKQAVRAMAQSQEEQQVGADRMMFNEMLADQLRIDGESPGYLGRARGGLSVQSRVDAMAARTGTIG